MSTVIQFPEREYLSLSDRITSEIKALMGRNDVSQTTLAHWLSLNQTAVSARLRGSTRWSLSDIERIAEGFAIHPAVLLGGYPTEPRPSPDGSPLPIKRAWRYSKPQPSDPKVLPLPDSAAIAAPRPVVCAA